MKRHSLTFMEAKKLGPGKYADGEGLWLCKSSAESGKWIVRLVITGNRREMGLGRWPDVSISEAREKAAKARRQVRDGFDPITERAKIKFQPKRLTVEEAINDCFRARQAELKEDGNAGRWMSPLRNHVMPPRTSNGEQIEQFEIAEIETFEQAFSRAALGRKL
ncbi:Arm DNA-binding domain-containing protein [Hyphomonas sediminis]|uniref:Arm DNA-binding domain-containing protein n=1 Tax=Hyphomonas sediminis TaxID=2866160 RepID=UPI0034E20A36